MINISDILWQTRTIYSCCKDGHHTNISDELFSLTGCDKIYKYYTEDGTFVMSRSLLSVKIANQFEKKILEEQKYQPGEKLPTERELAEEMNVSRTSVREAVKILSAKGVLEVRRGVGTFVADNPGVPRNPLGISDDDDIVSVLEDWYRVRMILEGEAMVLVVENASDAELAEIREIMEHEFRLMKEDEPTSDYLSEDQNFHCALARACHNRIIEKLVPSLHATVYYDMVKKLYTRLHPRFSGNAQNHELIMRCLEERDGQGAKIAMRYHMLKAIEDVRSLRNEE